MNNRQVDRGCRFGNLAWRDCLTINTNYEKVSIKKKLFFCQHIFCITIKITDSLIAQRSPNGFSCCLFTEQFYPTKLDTFQLCSNKVAVSVSVLSNIHTHSHQRCLQNLGVNGFQIKWSLLAFPSTTVAIISANRFSTMASSATTSHWILGV